MKSLSVLTSLACAGVLFAQKPPAATEPRPVDLAICLDISGSMNGLLNATRQNLWAVVNELAAMKPTPKLRVALLTFGCSAHDAAKGWVNVETGLTDDLDLVSQRLFALTTNGGEEYVGRVVQAALDQLEWSDDAQGLKLLFVAGNEAATQDPAVDFRAQCRAAIARGIVVNSIYCGSPSDELAPAWREVAALADGKFAAIEQDHGIVIETPFDAQLTALSTALNATYLPFGAVGQSMWKNQAEQDKNASSLNPAAAAQRCQVKGGDLYSNAAWDLVDACKVETFKLEEVKPEELPESMRAMTLEQRRAHIAEHQRKRDQLRKQVDELGQKRDAHVQQELKVRSDAGKAVFEQAVLEAVRTQAAGRGFERPKAEPAPAAKPATKPATKPDVVDPAFEKIVLAIADEYRKFACVTGMPRRAPTDCKISPPVVRRSEASPTKSEHGDKLYLLFARHSERGEYLVPGVDAGVGQTLVKEAWVCVEGDPKGLSEAGRRYLANPTLIEGDKRYHAGDFAGLFVMHKLAKDTPGTDRGWIYGTIDRSGKVTSAGRVASCMRCHDDATDDRRFGLR